MPPTAEDAPACAECEALRQQLDEERKRLAQVLERLGATTHAKALERIADLLRRTTTPTVMIRDGETIQEYERRKRLAAQAALPSAMF